jgi:hypothetical protein
VTFVDREYPAGQAHAEFMPPLLHAVPWVSRRTVLT